MLFKKLARHLIQRAQYLLGSGVWRNDRQIVRYEECSDDDKRYLIAYDNIRYELKSLKKTSYNRYKNKFIEYLSSTDNATRDAARELLDSEFDWDKDDITKILILK